MNFRKIVPAIASIWLAAWLFVSCNGDPESAAMPKPPLTTKDMNDRGGDTVAQLAESLNDPSALDCSVKPIDNIASFPKKYLDEYIRGVDLSSILEVESAEYKYPILTMLHAASSMATIDRYMGIMLQAPALNFDVIGFSYYPDYYGDRTDFETDLQNLADKYKKSIRAIMNNTVNNGVRYGIGSFWWEAAWLPLNGIGWRGANSREWYTMDLPGKPASVCASGNLCQSGVFQLQRDGVAFPERIFANDGQRTTP